MLGGRGETGFLKQVHWSEPFLKVSKENGLDQLRMHFSMCRIFDLIPGTSGLVSVAPGNVIPLIIQVHYWWM